VRDHGLVGGIGNISICFVVTSSTTGSSRDSWLSRPVVTRLPTALRLACGSVASGDQIRVQMSSEELTLLVSGIELNQTSKKEWYRREIGAEKAFY
jgi:hypothetical protein